MRTEDILQRDAEYRSVRDALGGYDVVLVLERPAAAGPPDERLPEAPPAAVRSALADPPSPRAPGASRNGPPGQG